MKKIVKVELSCKECGYKFIIDVDDEMYDNDYSISCEGCKLEQRLSYYNYYPLK
jgi:hypothetical protein